MKRSAIAITLVAMLATCASSASAALIITGVIDGPRSGGLPKAAEFYATTAIADLADYGVRSTNSAEGTAGGAEYTFPTGAVAAGTFITLASEAPGFTAYFGVAPTYTNGVMSINGDDAVVLYSGLLAATPVVVDVYGVPTADGTGSPWDHVDSYAYRNNGTGPDGATWVAANWTVTAPETLDAQGTAGVNGDAGITVPFGTYRPAVIPEPTTIGLAALSLLGLVTLRRRN
jgi:hypothetical protein